MRKQSAIILALLVGAVSVVGAASYTTATVDRQSGIQVSADNAALVGFDVGGGIGSNDDSVQTTADGEIDFNLDDAGTGVNGNATFHYGADGSTTARDRSNTAFNITNNDNAGRTFDLSYTDLSDTNTNVKFEVYTYDSAATTPFQQAGTVDEEGTSQSITLSSSESVYVFITVDTTAGDLGSSADLSGTFTVSAS